jgi:hypothetical protein
MTDKKIYFTKHVFIVTNENDQPIGIDGQSGGYPWVPDDPQLMKFWHTENEATRYAQFFKGYKVKSVRVSVVEE